MFCHTTERPAFSLGIGDFVAVDHLGNFDINDTIIQKVNKFHSHVFFISVFLETRWSSLKSISLFLLLSFSTQKLGLVSC